MLSYYTFGKGEKLIGFMLNDTYHPAFEMLEKGVVNRYSIDMDTFELYQSTGNIQHGSLSYNTGFKIKPSEIFLASN